MKKTGKKLVAILMTVMMVITTIPANQVFAQSVSTTSSTYYVSLSGDDSADGNEKTPFKTIAKGITVLQPADTLVIEEGIYDEPMVIDNKGSVGGLPIIIKGLGNVVINGEANMKDYPAWGEGYSGVLKMTDSNNIDISGITFSYRPTEEKTYGSAALIVKSVGIKLHNNSFLANENAGSCIQPNGTCTIEFDSNMIGGDCLRGFWLVWGLNNSIITNNVVKNQRGLDIACPAKLPTWQGSIENNTACNNTFIGGMAGSRESQDLFKKNTMANNIFGSAMVDVPAYVSRENTFANNCYNVKDASSAGKTLSSTEIAKDPLLVDATKGDYNLRDGSPCLMAGNFDYLPEKDFAGSIRKTADIGAFASKYISTIDFAISRKEPQGIGVSIESKVSVTFTDEVTTESSSLSNYITVTKAGGEEVPGTFAVLNNKVTFTPAANFDCAKEYTVTVKSGISSETGGVLNSNTSWNFTTQKNTSTGVQYFVATNGDDSNPGTISEPKKTASSLVSSLKPGDEVIFRSGVYNGIIVLDGKGSSDAGKKPITFKNYEGEKVTMTSDEDAYIIFLGHCQNIQIEGITFSGKKGEGRGNAVNVVNFDANARQTSDIVITNCKFVDCGTGIICRDVIDTGNIDKKFGNIEISNNIFMASDPTHKIAKGISMQECRVKEGCYAKIFNNVIINAKWSLYLWGRSENLLFYNNTMLDTYDQAGGSGEYDIYPTQGVYNKNINQMDISYHCVFKNNIFTKPIRTQLEANSTILDKDKGNVFNNNVYASNSLGNYVTYNYGGDGPTLKFADLQAYKNVGHEANGKYAVVEFIDPECDARLSGSDNPAITAATNIITNTVAAPATDLSGKKRISEAGAYAFDPSLVFVGSNSGAQDGSFSKPYSSLQSAVTAGATKIQVKDGTYNEDGLSVPAGITIAPYSAGATVTISGTVKINGTENKASVINNMTFNGRVTAEGKNVILSHCRFYSVVETADAEDITVMNSQFVSSNAKGVVIKNTIGSKIINNMFSKRTVGITLSEKSTANIIYNNTFVGNTANDVSIAADADNNALKNNIFSTANADNALGNTFSHNCYNTDTLSAEYLATITDTSSIKANPEFINFKNNDYRLYKLSPCVKAGVMDDFTPAKDINGIARSTPCDIGAYAVTDVQNIYYVAVSGDDRNSGTQTAPFATIGEAAKVVRQGEKVYISSGTYTEDVNIENKYSSSENSFVFKSLDEAKVKINGTVTVDNSTGITFDGIDISAGSNKTAFSIQTSPKTTLSNSETTGTVALSLTDSKDIHVSTLAVTNVQTGIIMNDSTLTLTRTKIKGASSAAISADKESSLKITSSVIMNCAKGIVGSGESDFSIINNTFYNIKGLSIDVTQNDGNDTKLDIYNNIHSRPERSKGAFVSINKADGFNSENNIYDADPSEIISIIKGDSRNLAQLQTGGDDKNSVAADPKFKAVQSENFAPAKESPAARKGYTSEEAPTADYAGTAFAEILDIGAYYSPYTLRTIHVAGYQCAWSDGDGSYDHPFQTLKQALSVMKSSDTIIIHKGIYNEGRHDLNNIHGVEDGRCIIEACTDPNEYWNQQFEEKNNIKLERPVFVGKSDYNDVSQTASADIFAKLVNCSYLTIKGIDIAGFTGAGIWLYNMCDNVELEDLRIWNIDQPAQSNSGVEGVLVNGVTNCRFKDLIIYNIGQTRKSHADHGMYVGGVENCTFENIVVSNSPGAGIQFYAGDHYNIHTKNITVKNSIFSECKYGLIMCGVENSLIVNNTFHNSLEDDLYLDWAVKYNTLQNNIFYNDITVNTNGVDPTVIAQHKGTAGINQVQNNLFTNNIYQYQYFAPQCQEGWGDKSSIVDYISAQNTNKTNTFTNFKAGKVDFVTGVIDKTATAKQQAEQVKDGLFRIRLSSDCVNTGLAENAPLVDIAGTKRTGNPDIGAYEAVDIRELVLSKNSISENNAVGDKVADIQVSGQAASVSDVFELIAGDGSDDNGSFTISGNTLRAGKSFDFEKKSSYKIRAKATINGETLEKAFLIKIDNVEEVPAIDKYINYINSAITIDGVINEAAWTNQLHELTVADSNNGSEFKAQMGLLADEKNLYISANVVDSELSNTIPADDWSADMIEVYIDGLNHESGAYDESTVQLQFRYNDDSFHVFGNNKKFTNIKFAIKPCDGGYQFEAMVPWSDLGVTFNSNKAIGFTANASDYDKSTDSYGSLAMIEGSGFWQNKSNWQTFGFIDTTKPVKPSNPVSPSSSSSSASTPSSTVTTITTTTGGTITTVTTAMDVAPTVAGNRSDIAVTVPASVASIINSATAKKTAEVKIITPTTSIIEQLKNSAVQTVNLTIQVPMAVASNTNVNTMITTSVEQAVFQAAGDAKKDIVVTIINYETGKGTYSWRFKGSDLAKSKVPVKDVNIAMNVRLTTEVPKVNVLTTKSKGLVLSFSHSGELPSVANVRVPVAEIGFKAGQTLYFYYYNPATKKIESQGSEYVVDQNGYIGVNISHCSDYVLLQNQILGLDTTMTYTMAVGETYGFLAYPKAGTTVTAKAADESILNVKLINAKDKRGCYFIIYGLKIGQTTVNVTSSDGSMCSFPVIVKAGKLKLDTKSYVLNTKNVYSIKADLYGVDSKRLKVYSTNFQIVSVVKWNNGLYHITGLKNGTASIVFEVYDEYGKMRMKAATHITVQKGVKSYGDSSRVIVTY
jgi:nitrous oxidase accessory protein NosD